MLCRRQLWSPLRRGVRCDVRCKECFQLADEDCFEIQCVLFHRKFLVIAAAIPMQKLKQHLNNNTMPFYGDCFPVVCIGVFPHECWVWGFLRKPYQVCRVYCSVVEATRAQTCGDSCNSRPHCCPVPPQQPCTQFAHCGAPAPPVLFPHPLPAAGVPFLSLFRAQHSFCSCFASQERAIPGYVFHLDFKKDII